jgi:hypothetical protein
MLRHLEERIQQLCTKDRATEPQAESGTVYALMYKSPSLSTCIFCARKSRVLGRSRNACRERRNTSVLDEISKNRVKELCDQIAKEQDHYRFSLLISELNRILETSRAGSNGNVALSVSEPS